MEFPNFDPEIFSFSVGGMQFALRWYALAYIAGILIGWRLVVRMARKPALWGGNPPYTRDQGEEVLTWMVVGIILGGRLGFVMFYQPGYYLSNPGDILKIWQGGMSFHGGFLGVVVATILFAWRQGIPMIPLGDAIAAVTPIGLFFGRIANFINGELWGRPTASSLGMVFPDPRAHICPDGWIGECTRHPSQLYEAGLEGIVLGLILWFAVRAGALAVPGRIIGLFMLGYGLARMVIELFREADDQYITPDNPLGHVLSLGPSVGLSMGQILSLPMLAVGCALIVLSRRPAA